MPSPALPLSDAELASLASQVEQQLASLRTDHVEKEAVRGQKVPTHSTRKLPLAPKQQAVIEQISGESFDSFWQKYLYHARKDLCLPGGILHEQWKKWRDLESKAAVRISYGWLAIMGISHAMLAPAAVAVSVFLLNVVTNIGIKTICDDCAEKVKEHHRSSNKPKP